LSALTFEKVLTTHLAQTDEQEIEREWDNMEGEEL
jgi:hypothetical protein